MICFALQKKINGFRLKSDSKFEDLLKHSPQFQEIDYLDLNIKSVLLLNLLLYLLATLET